MSQQGIRSFFCKKENIEPQQKNVQSSTFKTSPVKRKQNYDEEEETQEHESPPLVKTSKRRRVIIDSDDEEPLDASVSMDTSSRELAAGENTAEETDSLQKNQPILDFKTPPKRATARKHTCSRRTTVKDRVSAKSDKCKEESMVATETVGMVDDKKTVQASRANEDMMETADQSVNDAVEVSKRKIEGSENEKTGLKSKSPDKLKDIAEKKNSPGGGSCWALSKDTKNKQRKDCSTTVAYNPGHSKYHPVEDACWKRGQNIPYMAIARTFEQIEEESGRLKIIGILTNFLRSVIALSPQETVKCVYLCLNKLGPAYEGLELGIGESILIKAISDATGRSPQHIKSEVADKGDLGLVAMGSRSTQRTMFTPPPLTVNGVFNKLKEIASLSGSSSQAKKVQIIKGLFVACKNSEAKYLMRNVQPIKHVTIQKHKRTQQPCVLYSEPDFNN